MSKSLEDTITRNMPDGEQTMDRIRYDLLYPNFITKILYEGYDKYLILDIEAISLSLSWLLIDTFDSEKSYGINVRLQS